MIISLLQEKGGTGKTTIAINLAKAFQNKGHSVLLVDTDVQQSASDWHSVNESNSLELLTMDAKAIKYLHNRNFKKYDYIFIDGAPTLSSLATQTIVHSDMVLIPIKPSPYDIWAARPLADLVLQRQEFAPLKGAFVISCKKANTRLSKEVDSALDKYGLPVLKCGTFDRIAYIESAAKGETVLEKNSRYSKAQNDINLLTEEVLRFAHE